MDDGWLYSPVDDVEKSETSAVSVVPDIYVGRCDLWMVVWASGSVGVFGDTAEVVV